MTVWGRRVGSFDSFFARAALGKPFCAVVLIVLVTPFCEGVNFALAGSDAPHPAGSTDRRHFVVARLVAHLHVPLGILALSTGKRVSIAVEIEKAGLPSLLLTEKRGKLSKKVAQRGCSSLS